VIGHDFRPAPLADQSDDLADAALDGHRAAERILRQLDATTSPDRLFGKVFELLDRRDPADGPHPQLRSFLATIQRELVRRGAA
jgi:hypothetical protein